jgi:hypothetical protein
MVVKHMLRGIKSKLIIVLFVSTLTSYFVFAVEQKDFLDAITSYETAVFDTSVSIEFYEHGTVFVKKDGKIETHYTIKKYYRYDLAGKKIYSKVVDFNLIEGKNRDKIKTGDTKEESLKKLYGLTDVFSMKWKEVSIDDEKLRISFSATEWFVTFECHMTYDHDTLFPLSITILTNKGAMEMNMAFSEHSSLYMLDSFVSKGNYNFLFSDHEIDIRMQRDEYIITRK